MTSKTETIVIIDGRESVAASWARDAVSFGGLIGTAYVLNVLMPPSGWLNAALAVCWFLWLLGKAANAVSKVRLTPEQARDKIAAIIAGDA